MPTLAHGERRDKRENAEEERRRMPLEGVAAIRASSAAELRFRLEAGKRLTTKKRKREQMNLPLTRNVCRS